MSFQKVWAGCALAVLLLFGCDSNPVGESGVVVSQGTVVSTNQTSPVNSNTPVNPTTQTFTSALVSSNTQTNPNTQTSTLSLPDRRVGIVYSETTAKKYFDEFAYGQLFTAMQHQAMQAGVPYDLLKEADLVNAGTLFQYDALIIPVMSHVNSAYRDQMMTTLAQAQESGLAIITSSEFMTYDENNQAHVNAYGGMINLLGLTPKRYLVGVPAKLKVLTNDHAITKQYRQNELIDEYNQTWFAEFSPVEGSQSTALVGSREGSESYHLVHALENKSRVVHFANDEFLADNNLLWSAIRWALYGNSLAVTLSPSRSSSLFIARNDMDQAMVAPAIHLYEFPLLSFVRKWKNDFNFVGSYYIDIGNDPENGYYTNWGVSGPLYQQYIALGNEFGTHSWTHPHYTSELNDTELEFEFNQSAKEIGTQLGVNVIGGAVPGNPENLNVVENLNQWFEYFSGRSITGSTGYRSGVGFLNPEHKMRYFNLNMTPDFGLIDFLNYTPIKAQQIWKDEFNALLDHAKMPVMHWLWHDYGPTAEAKTGRYSVDMFEDTIALAYNAGSEFATLEDYHYRLNALESARLGVEVGNNISASVVGSGLGQFALKLEDGQRIASVANWYAYSDKAVFIPDNGGDFVITPGSQPASVTRIAKLPMRARLLSVNGNGNELNFRFRGEGDITIALSSAMVNNFNVTGTDSYTIQGNNVVLSFPTVGEYTVGITAFGSMDEYTMGR